MIRTYSNKQRGSECTFPFIYDLSLTIRRLSFSSKWYFLFSWHFRSNNLLKIGKKLITEFHRVQQTKWHELNQTDRERWNVHFDSLMIISHFKKYFFLSKKVLLVIMTQNSKNLQKWVDSWNLTNDGRQPYSFEAVPFYWQKQPSRGVLRKRCSENMQQIDRRTTMPKFDFNKVAKQLYWNHNSAWVFSCKFAAYFSGWLLLYWLKVKSQYAHHFLQQDALRIFRNRIHCIIHTETYKQRLMLEFGEQDLLGVPFRTERKPSYHER